MNDKIEILMGVGATIGFGVLAYYNIRAFADIYSATGDLQIAIEKLQDYASSASSDSLTAAKDLISHAQTAITSHFHIFPIGKDASELTDVVNSLSSVSNVPLAVNDINEIIGSYSGIGNCPHRMTLTVLGTLISLGYTLKNIF